MFKFNQKGHTTIQVLLMCNHLHDLIYPSKTQHQVLLDFKHSRPITKQIVILDIHFVNT